MAVPHAHQPNRTGCPQNDKNELRFYKKHRIFVKGELQNVNLMG